MRTVCVRGVPRDSVAQGSISQIEAGGSCSFNAAKEKELSNIPEGTGLFRGEGHVCQREE